MNEVTEASALDYLRAHPAALPHLRACVVWASRHPAPFHWWEVRVWQKVLDRLTVDGLLQRLEGASYVVVDAQAVLRGIARFEGEQREAEDRIRQNPGAPVAPPPGAPRDLFSEIIGFEQVKRRLLLALGSPDPADGHALLYGPPATAKSLFMEALASLPGAVYRFADGMSRAGIRRYLLDERPPYLVIDEFDKFSPEDDTVLLEFLERQRVSQLVTGRNRDEAVNIRVYAAANNISRVRPELLSRFDKIRFAEYTLEEFRQIAHQYLVRRGTDPGVAELIAAEVAVKTRDIRDARRIAGRSRSIEDARFLLDELNREARV